MKQAQMGLHSMQIPLESAVSEINFTSALLLDYHAKNIQQREVRLEKIGPPRQRIRYGNSSTHFVAIAASANNDAAFSMLRPPLLLRLVLLGSSFPSHEKAANHRAMCCSCHSLTFDKARIATVTPPTRAMTATGSAATTQAGNWIAENAKPVPSPAEGWAKLIARSYFRLAA
jgi:hypothetical protein